MSTSSRAAQPLLPGTSPLREEDGLTDDLAAPAVPTRASSCRLARLCELASAIFSLNSAVELRLIAAHRQMTRQELDELPPSRVWHLR